MSHNCTINNKMERTFFFGMRSRLKSLMEEDQMGRSLSFEVQLKTPLYPLSPTGEELPTSDSSAGLDNSAIRNVVGYLESAYPPSLSVFLDKLLVGSSLERVVEDLPDSQDEINRTDAFGWSLLHEAVRSSDVEVVRSLLERGADPNYLNCLQRSPLHLSAIENCPEIVSLLLQFGADVNRCDFENWTPLHYAVHLGHMQVVEVLMSSKPDLTILTSNNRTVWDLVDDQRMYATLEKWALIRVLESPQDSVDTLDISEGRRLRTKSNQLMTHLHRCHSGDLKNQESSPVMKSARRNELTGVIVEPHPHSAYS